MYFQTKKKKNYMPKSFFVFEILTQCPFFLLGRSIFYKLAYAYMYRMNYGYYVPNNIKERRLIPLREPPIKSMSRNSESVLLGSMTTAAAQAVFPEEGGIHSTV